MKLDFDCWYKLDEIVAPSKCPLYSVCSTGGFLLIILLFNSMPFYASAQAVYLDINSMFKAVSKAEPLLDERFKRGPGGSTAVFHPPWHNLTQ